MEGSEEYAAECYRSGVIAVGWNDVGDLNKFASREELKAKCAKLWPDDSNRSIEQTAGVLWNFRSSVKEGDVVICPDRESGRFYIGRILSRKAFYDRSPLDGKCRFAHRRKVRWERILTPMNYGVALGDVKQCQRSRATQVTCSNHRGSIVAKLAIVAFHFVPIWSGDWRRKTEPCNG